MNAAIFESMFIPSRHANEPGRSTSLYIPPNLLRELDRVVAELNLKSRSALIVEVMQAWIAEYNEKSSKAHR
jgi:metal-responsive CopG/Arc/MetJ family transcriptional regulator